MRAVADPEGTRDSAASGDASTKDGGGCSPQSPGVAACVYPSSRLSTDPAQSPRKRRRRRHRSRRHLEGDAPVYGALDLGTNNCRLLIARPAQDGFKVIDAFSRIVRLGEGATITGRLSEVAMQRTIEALKVCSGKLAWRKVSRARLIATEACRMARNGSEFIERVHDETGLLLEIIDRETEAGLAVAGSMALLERNARNALVFDIGGGSTELMWLDLDGNLHKTIAWTSVPIGVVTLAERFGGIDVTPELFASMVTSVMEPLSEFREKVGARPEHMLGTSGTVTTIAGVHLRLPRYDRSRVDGCWLRAEDIASVTAQLISMSYEERVASPCIGMERADLVLAGCAILEAIRSLWPVDRIRVADRGLREGILTTMMREDGTFGSVHPDRRARHDGTHRRKT